MICGAFTMATAWLGLFNLIQERHTKKRVLKFTSYMSYKIIILSLIYLIQAIACITIVYYHLNPRPEETLLINPLIDLITNFFLISFLSSMIGLFISSIVKETKTTLILSPLYMMLQMLFSGMFIPFVEITKKYHIL